MRSLVCLRRFKFFFTFWRRAGAIWEASLRCLRCLRCRIWLNGVSDSSSTLPNHRSWLTVMMMMIMIVMRWRRMRQHGREGEGWQLGGLWKAVVAVREQRRRQVWLVVAKRGGVLRLRPLALGLRMGGVAGHWQAPRTATQVSSVLLFRY